MTKTPAFYPLSLRECQVLLARNHVGRLAFRSGPNIDIQPIGYVARRDWLFMRSAYGAKLEALAHDPFVAFEVDEVHGPFDWRSVVAHGTIYLLSPEGAPAGSDYTRALRALRRVFPSTLTIGDPVPEREIVYGLHIQRLDGRMAESTQRPTKARRRGIVVKPTPRRILAPDGF
jgi:nitroimidazol reductase NimA-like FMN-containing flavoprotein (pyridoxamine 5'-phosphate oxidase superfamily)